MIGSKANATGSGRVRLRPNRGFPLGLVQQCHPQKFSFGLFGYFDISRCPNKVRVLGSAIFCLMPTARGFSRFERLICGGNIAGECDAGSPGSDGASPYLSFTLAQDFHPPAGEIVETPNHVQPVFFDQISKDRFGVA
jgi:hypothetical protein